MSKSQTHALGGTRLLEAMRTNRWPDRSLVQVIAVYLIVAYLPMMWQVYCEATGRVGSDFLAFWGAGRLVMAGTPSAVYDFMAQNGAQAASHTGHVVKFVNPPPYLFLTAPLALMPYGVAWLVWALAGWAVWFLVCRRLIPGQPLLLVSYPAAYLAASHAQNGFVTGSLLVGGVIALSRSTRPGERLVSDILAGALFGALVIKPHLALLVPLWLIAGRRWHALGAGAVSALLLCLFSLSVFGMQTWTAWPQTFPWSASLMKDSGPEFFERMATAFALMRLVVGANAAMAGQVVITLAMAALVWHETRRNGANAATGALMLAATALASPYLFSYDLPFLVQPVLWLVGTARARGWRPWEKIGVIAQWLAPLATRAAALPLHGNLMPLASIALLWMIASRLSSDQSTISGCSRPIPAGSSPPARGSGNTSTKRALGTNPCLR